MNRRKVTPYLLPNLGALLILVLALTGNLGAQGTAAVGQQAATTTMSYQGRLTSPDGQPVTASLPMSFALYTAPTTGEAVWTESRSGANGVPVTNGLFNVLLGSVVPIGTNLLNQDLWLGISVDGDICRAPAFGEAKFEAIMIRISMFSLLSTAKDLLQAVQKGEAFRIGVATMTTIDLGIKKVPYEKTDEVQLIGAQNGSK